MSEGRAAHAAAAIAACTALIAKYTHVSDARDNEGFAKLFLADGEWIRLDGQHRMQGRREIAEFLDSARPSGTTRHFSGSVWVEVLNESHARGLSYSTVYRDSNWNGSSPALLTGPEAIVEYRDEFVHQDGDWYFKRREARYVFAAANAIIARPRSAQTGP